MSCIKCSSERVAYVNAKCRDLCYVSIQNLEHDGYVPADMNIGGGDYVRFEYCLDCGQIQGEFPSVISKLEGRDEE